MPQKQKKIKMQKQINKIVLVHQIPGRVRFRAKTDKFNVSACSHAGKILSELNGIKSCEINPRNKSILIYYETDIFDAEKLLDIANQTVCSSIDKAPQPDGQETQTSIVWSYIGYQLFRFFCPPVLKPVFTVIGAFAYIRAALKHIVKLKFDVSVLDAAAIGVSLITGNFKAASTLIMLLKSGQYLESWARQRSHESLASALSFNAGDVWVRRKNGDELIPYNKLSIGDEIVLRSGALIPVDGVITSGSAYINESSMTGEAMAALRFSKDRAHAGTVIEDGEITVSVENKGDKTRYHNIIKLVEESQNSKAKTEKRANELANAIAPFSLIAAFLTFVFTRNASKAQSVLAVDYSCAIKLAAPIVFISAMRESLSNGAFFKGSAPVEKLAFADTVIFDKTGTLTKSVPEVADVTPFNGENQKHVLKIAACLEEHFPHPVAKAVVKYAQAMNVKHREEHSQVKYIAAHGIATLYKGKHTVIGSKHFVSEDEGIDISQASEQEEKAAKEGSSVLYLATDGKLIGVITINDPIRPEAKEAIQYLRLSGIKNIYLLSGDNKPCVKRIAQELGMDGFQAELLPEDKTVFVKKLQEAGRSIAFVGDGMNDSPALAAADVGIAMKDGAELAQNAADVVLKTSSLYSLVAARIIAQRAIKRQKNNTVTSITVNSFLILLGFLGGSFSRSIWLHNLTTLTITLNSMRQLLKKS
jgi:Cu2+-exporting ATPase